MPILGWIGHAVEFIPAAFKIGKAASELFNPKTKEAPEDTIIRINEDQLKYKGITINSDGDIIKISYKYKKFTLTVEYDS